MKKEKIKHECFYCDINIPSVKDEERKIFQWHLDGHGETEDQPPKEQPAEDWRDQLLNLSEKYCKHDNKKYNSCLYHILEPFITQLIQAEREKI